MQFPYFQFPWLGDGLVIAIDAILHVVISHGVAIGMIAMIVLAEWIGHRRGDLRWERLAQGAIKPAVIIITGVGAVTGVGIWFITSGLIPAGIGSMLRVFFWPWFIEWIAFVSEVIVVLIYYFTWRRWEGAWKRRHIQLGLAYVIFAGISAFLITGILGFMLTSDGWPSSRGLAGAFFNPTLLPQLAWRVAISLAMGMLFMLFYVLFNRHTDGAFRRETLRAYAAFLGLPLALMVVSGWWWWTSIPPAFKVHAIPPLQAWHHPPAGVGLWAMYGAIAAIPLLLLAPALLRWVALSRALIIPAGIAVIFFVAEYERVREFLRGPFLMPGYMYANGILVTEHNLFTKEGMLPYAYWYKQTVPHPTAEEEGAFLFAQNCGTCHTIGGRNDIRDRFRGRTEKGIYVILGRTGQMVPWMPPFSGNDEERRKTAKFLNGLLEGEYGLTAPARYPPSEALRPR